MPRRHPNDPSNAAPCRRPSRGPPASAPASATSRSGSGNTPARCPCWSSRHHLKSTNVCRLDILPHTSLPPTEVAPVTGRAPLLPWLILAHSPLGRVDGFDQDKRARKRDEGGKVLCG